MEPHAIDNFAAPLGVDFNTILWEEAWFEHRYPNLLEDSRVKFTGNINDWIQNNWGQPAYNETSPRISVVGQNFYNNPQNAATTWNDRLMRDDRYQGCGDIPQTFNESDIVLGRFALDFETPVMITYSQKSHNGRMVRAFEWKTVMYVEDKLGTDPHDSISFLSRIAPGRRVKRARWEIKGSGMNAKDIAYQAPEKTHWIQPGDTLTKLAERYYQDKRLWLLIYKRNYMMIGESPNVIKAFSTLVIPDLSTLSQSVIDEARSTPLPPPGSGNVITMPPLR